MDKPPKHNLGEVVDKSECIIWQRGTNSGGYPVVWHDGKTRMYNRLLWQEHYGPIPEKYCVCHKCDTPSCVNIDHLFLDTYKNNMKDMVLKNRHNRARGERHPRAMLNVRKVRNIRRMHAEGIRTIDIMKKYNASYGCIAKVINGQTWAWVKPLKGQNDDVRNSRTRHDDKSCSASPE
jgi:hypothetical protein